MIRYVHCIQSNDFYHKYCSGSYIESIQMAVNHGLVREINGNWENYQYLGQIFKLEIYKTIIYVCVLHISKLVLS